jgi:D-glycero-alpha-D-manno-heptose-7-phosphate kinase
MLIVRSPVRISFGGGGTDLPAYYEQFGGAVLSVAINKYFYTILGKRSDGRIQVISSDLRVFESWQDLSSMQVKGNPLEIPLAVLKDLNCNIAVDLFLASEIPPGTGLGSSASVCVNVLKTLTTYLHQPLSKYDLAERAFRLVRNDLGRNVGKQDEYAAAFGGLNYFTFAPDGQVTTEAIKISPMLSQGLQSHLLLFFTGAAHNSWTILKEQETSARQRTGPAVDALHEVKAIGAGMRDALLKENLHRLGELLHLGWLAKRRVSAKISDARIDGLYDLARERGALGGKITGAGGGGFLLLYCEPSRQRAVREALQEKGLQEMTFAFDMQGAQVVVNDPFIDRDERGGSRWVFVSTETPGIAPLTH